MSIDINNFTPVSLATLENGQLINMVLAMNEELQKLKKSADTKISSDVEKRLEQLEREVNKDKQYLRRDSVEIAGISPDIQDDDIEDECIKVLKAAKAKVGNRYANSLDIHAAHRIGKKGNVIIKFANRKFAAAAISNRSNLKESTDHKGVYINQSLCPEFKFLNFAVRKAKQNGEIHFYKMKYGLTLIQKEPNDNLIEISHVNDLVRNNLTVPDRRS